MARKSVIVFSGLLCISLLVKAQESWLLPVKFIVKPGEDVIVSFKTGENFLGESWNFKKDEAERLELHHKNTMKDLTETMAEGEKNNLKITPAEEGTYAIILRGENTLSDVSAKKFNAYLQADGLDDAYAHREKTNTLNKDATELYTPCAKLIVQAGEKTDNTFRKETALPVEIIPLQNPYALKVGDPIQFKILFKGKPLFGVKVKVWNYSHNRTTVQNIYSQQDGTISTHISNTGAWMVSFVKMVPSKDPRADWQSYKASLVFGVK